MIEKLKIMFSAIGDFLLPFLKQFMSAAGPMILDAAQKAVSTMAQQLAMPNAEKRDAAFAMITADLKRRGIEAATSTINGAIEAAVARLKS